VRISPLRPLINQGFESLARHAVPTPRRRPHSDFRPRCVLPPPLHRARTGPLSALLCGFISAALIGGAVGYASALRTATPEPVSVVALIAGGLSWRDGVRSGPWT